MEPAPEILDVVELRHASPEQGLAAAARGTMLEDSGDGVYLVDFIDDDGEPVAVIDLTADEFTVVWRIADHPPKVRRPA